MSRPWRTRLFFFRVGELNKFDTEPILARSHRSEAQPFPRSHCSCHSERRYSQRCSVLSRTQTVCVAVGENRSLLGTVADPIILEYHRCVPVTSVSGERTARKPGSSSGSATTENQNCPKPPCEDHPGGSESGQGRSGCLYVCSIMHVGCNSLSNATVVTKNTVPMRFMSRFTITLDTPAHFIRPWTLDSVTATSIMFLISSQRPRVGSLV